MQPGTQPQWALQAVQIPDTACRDGPAQQKGKHQGPDTAANCMFDTPDLYRGGLEYHKKELSVLKNLSDINERKCSCTKYQVMHLMD